MSALVIGLTALVAANSWEPISPGGHPYRVYWPNGTAHGMVVFLHGVSSDPIAEEGPGMDALARRATDRGLIAIIPIAHRACSYASGHGARRCWDIDRVEDELSDIEAIMAHVQKRTGVCLAERHIIGFSNGGFLVAGALQRGLLDGFTRVGIIAAGPVGQVTPPDDYDWPDVFIAVGRKDRYQKRSTIRLVSMLRSADDDGNVRFREVAGGHVFDRDRAAEFLSWFWGERHPQCLLRPGDRVRRARRVQSP